MKVALVNQRTKRMLLYNSPQKSPNAYIDLKFVDCNISKNPNGSYEIVANLGNNDYLLLTAQKLIEE